MKKPLSALLMGLALTAAPALSWSAASLTVSVTSPAGSSSLEYSRRLVTSMLMTPCLATTDIDGTANVFGAVGPGPQAGVTVNNPFDQLLVTIRGANSDDDRDGAYDYDLYVLLVNQSGDGDGTTPATIANSRFFVFSRYDRYTDNLTPGVEVYLRATSADLNLDPAPVYLRAADFASATINETLLGGNIAFDGYGLAQGTWLVVAILSTETEIDFTEPRTWAKWDAKPFILGAPWNVDKTCSEPPPSP